MSNDKSRAGARRPAWWRGVWGCERAGRFAGGVAALLVAGACGDYDTPSTHPSSAVADGEAEPTATPKAEPNLEVRLTADGTVPGEILWAIPEGMSRADWDEFVLSYLAGLDGGPPNPALTSEVCGDGRFHAIPAGVYPGPWVVNEECDDGDDDERDLCTTACQLSDTLVEYQVPSVDPVSGRAMPWLNQSRSLGEGRHPVSANGHGFAVAYVEPGDTARVGVSVFDAQGDPQPALEASAFGTALLFSNPVVAGRLDGSFVVAYTEYDGDSDVLGIALTEIDPEAGTAAPMGYANGTPEFSQYDADIIAVGQQIVVAWTDDRDPIHGPDLYYRILGSAVDPDGSGSPEGDGLVAGGELPLAATAAREGNVALARLGASFGAAWRASADDGLETLEIEDFGASAHFSVGPQLPGLAEDHPALVELSDTLRLVVFSTGEDEDENGNIDGVATTASLSYAILDTTAPGSVSAQAMPFAAPFVERRGVGNSHPNAVRVGDEVYVAWRSATVLETPAEAAAGENVWLMPVTLNGSGTSLVAGTPRELPRWAKAHHGGDQRFPALAATPSWPEGHQLGTPALAAAWVDYGRQFEQEEGSPDVMVQLSPMPSHRRRLHRDCSEGHRCGVGEGRCSLSGESYCELGLVCHPDAGPNFGWHWNFPVCIPESCVPGGELICGGNNHECGICHCPDGVASDYLEEECDEGGFGAHCTPSCELSSCGDELVNAEAGEQCEPSTSPDCDPLTCTLPSGCTDPTRCFAVFSQPQGAPEGDPWIVAALTFANGSEVSVDLDTVTVRYWFTRDHDRPLATECSSATPPPVCSVASVSLVEITPVAGADTYLELDFNASAPTVEPGEIRLTLYELGIEVLGDPAVNFDERDDYSWMPPEPGDPLNANPHITAYINGVLVWGTEPQFANTPVCGNALLEFGEACDDGNIAPGDGCSASCAYESGVCGNGALNAGEACDDGNIIDGDGCDSNCDREPAECGDGAVNQPSEACDDGNTTPNDGCNPACQLECGDGTLQPGESCDPALDFDCNSSCTGSLACMEGGSCLSAWTMPMGVLDDDAITLRMAVRNNGSGTVALSDIRVRYWFTAEGAATLNYQCTFATLGCASIAANVYSIAPLTGADHYLDLRFTGGGTLAPGERTGLISGVVKAVPSANFNELDDFSYMNEAAIAANTRVTVYVAGVLVWGDEPYGVGAPYCGDGAVNQPSEECDDGNGVDTDSCVSGCQSAECGDGYLRAGVEVCDPGLDSSCLADCSGYSPGACTTLASCFGVEHQSDGSPTDNHLLPRFILRNHGSTVINLTQVTLRYWFSAEGEPSPLTAVCDWAELLENTGIGGTTLVRMSITAVSSPDASATHYLDVSFATGAGSLNPGQSTGRIDMRVFPKDWANWNESNDYSNTGSTSFVVAPKVALYVGGTLVWGDVW